MFWKRLFGIVDITSDGNNLPTNRVPNIGDVVRADISKITRITISQDDVQNSDNTFLFGETCIILREGTFTCLGILDDGRVWVRYNITDHKSIRPHGSLCPHEVEGLVSLADFYAGEKYYAKLKKEKIEILEKQQALRDSLEEIKQRNQEQS
jgi:hypothetical protein